MGFLDTILWPIKLAVAWIMVGFHEGLAFVGVSGGVAWVLSIVGLVVVIRVLLIPLFFKQIKAARGMQMLQPDMQKLQKKYKGKTDPASRQAMQEEMMALYKHHGTNPFASCLPILAQTPIFFALFRVLYSLGPLARGEYSRPSIGPITQQVATEIESSTLFGASLSSWFLEPGASTQVRIVTVILIVAMSVTTFTTQRQLTMKNMPAAALDNPMARQQKILMYILPLVFAFSGVNFPIGVLLYWLTTNLWSMGQQFYTIRRMPAPGSEAEKKFKERQARKAARKGIAPEVEAAAPAPVQEVPRGQRVQPKRKDRQKRSGAAPTAGTPASAGAAATEGAVEESEAPVRRPAVPAGSTSPQPTSPAAGAAALTPEERAARRHAERAARRQAERARQDANQGKKKRQ
jgi:YidC/Oxa1 family membrane protein insertase